MWASDTIYPIPKEYTGSLVSSCTNSSLPRTGPWPSRRSTSADICLCSKVGFRDCPCRRLSCPGAWAWVFTTSHFSLHVCPGSSPHGTGFHVPCASAPAAGGHEQCLRGKELTGLSSQKSSASRMMTSCWCISL